MTVVPHAFDADWATRVVGDVGVRGSALECALIVGPPGSGRSRMLGELTARLRDNGSRIVFGLPSTPIEVPPDDTRRAIVVADDLHTWPRELIDGLVAQLDEGRVALVGSTEARERDRGIAGLIGLARRGGAEWRCRPMSTGDVVDRAAAQGLTLTATDASHIRRRCIGASALVDVVLAAVVDDDDPDPEAIATRVAADRHHRVLRGLDETTLGVLALAADRAALDPDALAATLDCPLDDVVDALDRARGTGFLGGSDVFYSTAISSLTEVIGALRMTELRRRAAGVLVGSGALSVDDALRAVDAGILEPLVVDTLCTEAVAAGRTDPSRAVALLAAAEAAGGRLAELRPLRARSLWAAGDLAGAEALIDDTIGLWVTPSADAAEAVAVAAEIATAGGRHHHAAELFCWLGPEHCGEQRVSAVAALVAVGERTSATSYLGAGDGPPSIAHRAADLVIEGLLETSDRRIAVDAVLRAWSAGGDRDTLRAAAWPALALAVHAGDLVAARAIADAASCFLGGAGAAWVALIGDDLQAARQGSLPTAATPTDRLRTLALQVGIARRTDDAEALARAWHQAVPLIATLEVTLFDLFVVGELWLAAVRLGDTARIERHITTADALLDAVGDREIWRPLWQRYTQLTTGQTTTETVTDSDGPLTDREAEVARELLAGYTYREIGERLYISAKTVEHHVARIRRRLDAGSRSELLAAIRAAGYR
ncbi:helix-turn-helix transcriptional regulator [Gordonia insulae]|uniref:HTH luxR-type domain-containing protein n=1 Tax=Gordonia insulae TaxID=2420509 RepID=A0A3G8JMM5_9ACTN|nr:helix-turn-helix transcriptional regulator [Gordonia insulae]AZG46336.1 hypothetical protein D7316_02937 [Gordonia insulae]